MKDSGLQEVFSRVWKTGISESFPVAVYREDRISVWRDYSVHKSPSGEIVVLSRDETQLKEAEEATRESEEMFQTITFSAMDAIIMMDDKGHITYTNAASERMFGFTKEEMVSMALETLLAQKHYTEALRKSLEHFRRSGQENIIEKLIELNAVRKDGTEFPIEMSLSVVRLKGKWHVMGVARDISERKRAEEEKVKLESLLQQAQKMEAIGTLAGGIAHDFNNVLFPIIGYTEMTLSEVSGNERASRNLQEVLKAANRAKALIQQILTFSRRKEEQRSPLEIQPIIKEALKLLRSSLPSTIEIRQGIGKDCGSVMADPTQIHQVIMNLCTNAYHAMRDNGGTLEVSLARVEVDPADITADSDLIPGPYLRLTVRDTGHGMEDDILERIFDPYFTTKGPGEGTGMGLAVVHGIVKSHGGHIKVISEPGQGASFSIHLPVISSPKTPLEIPAAEDVPGGEERILYVDDEAQIVHMGSQMLEGLGYRITARTSSVEAFDTFLTQPEDYDLVITDLTMPRMTGTELARKLMDIRPEIPIILCTGFNEIIEEEKVKAAGIREYVMKPFVMSEIAHAIRRVMDQDKGQPGVGVGVHPSG